MSGTKDEAAVSARLREQRRVQHVAVERYAGTDHRHMNINSIRLTVGSAFVFRTIFDFLVFQTCLDTLS
jgi:hypothetical protein